MEKSNKTNQKKWLFSLLIVAVSILIVAIWVFYCKSNIKKWETSMDMAVENIKNAMLQPPRQKDFLQSAKVSLIDALGTVKIAESAMFYFGDNTFVRSGLLKKHTVIENAVMMKQHTFLALAFVSYGLGENPASYLSAIGNFESKSQRVAEIHELAQPNHEKVWQKLHLDYLTYTIHEDMLQRGDAQQAMTALSFYAKTHSQEVMTIVLDVLKRSSQQDTSDLSDSALTGGPYKNRLLEPALKIVQSNEVKRTEVISILLKFIISERRPKWATIYIPRLNESMRSMIPNYDELEAIGKLSREYQKIYDSENDQVLETLQTFPADHYKESNIKDLLTILGYSKENYSLYASKTLLLMPLSKKILQQAYDNSESEQLKQKIMDIITQKK